MNYLYAAPTPETVQRFRDIFMSSPVEVHPENFFACLGQFEAIENNLLGKKAIVSFTDFVDAIYHLPEGNTSYLTGHLQVSVAGQIINKPSQHMIMVKNSRNSRRIINFLNHVKDALLHKEPPFEFISKVYVDELQIFS